MPHPNSETSKNLLELLDAPIAFHRVFVKISGGVTAGLLLSQAFYWSKNKRAKQRDGWFYKSHAEWEEETGLTRREQQTARGHLREKKLLEEKVDVLPGRGRVLWFRVNLDGLKEALKDVVEQSSTEPEASSPRAVNMSPSRNETARGVAQNRQTPLNETARPIEQKRQTPLIISETTSGTDAKNTQTQADLRAGGAPVGGVCAGSKFSLAECLRYAEHLHASGQGITNPGGFARKIHSSGSEDEMISLFFSRGPSQPGQIISIDDCTDCDSAGFTYESILAGAVIKCKHPKLIGNELEVAYASH